MKFTLRKKIALWMLIVGIVPALTASLFGISVIVGRFKENINQEAQKNLMISLNLMINQIEAVKEASITLSKKTELKNSVQSKITGQIKREFDYLGHGMIHVLDKKGNIVNAIPLGAINWNISPQKIEAGYEENLKSGKNMIRNVLNNYSYELDITSWAIDKKKNLKNLYIRAIAPLLDYNYNLKGAVAITIAMDSLFCDNLSTILGANILLYSVSNNRVSTFVSSLKNEDGIYLAKSPIPPNLINQMIKTKTDMKSFEFYFNGSNYSAVIHALRNNKGKLIGFMAAATNISSFNKGKKDAIKAVGGFTAISFIIALILGSWLAINLTKPLKKLLEVSQSVSQGNLKVSIETKSNDEIGELATTFNLMVKNLKTLQDRQAAQISEIQSLHEIFNNVSVKVKVEDIIFTTMESVQFTLQTKSVAFVYKNEQTGKFDIMYKNGDCSEQLINYKVNSSKIYEEVINTKKVIEEKSIKLCDENINIIACPVIHEDDVVAVIMLVLEEESSGVYQLHVIKNLAERLPLYLLNARLFERISIFNEQLELMVEERTKELQESKKQLEQTLKELTDTQAQVLITERLAGLGTLLAGVAHEINSPISAIDTAISSLSSNMRSFVERMILLMESDADKNAITYMLTLMKNFAEDYKQNNLYRKTEISKVKQLSDLFEKIGIQKQRRSLARKFLETGSNQYIEMFIETHFDIKNLSDYIYCMYDFIKITTDSGSVAMSVSAVEKIVIALRTYSHVKQDFPEAVNIHDIIETSLVILANKLKRKVKVIKEYSENIPPVTVYGDELSQVWTNLIINAVHAMEPDGGTITLTTEYLKDREQIVVHIKDTGSGIPPEIIDKIFDPFFTTKKKGKGTGLGLGIVYRIVKERHGGDIKVKSKPGETVFSVYLPLKVQNSSKTSA